MKERIQRALAHIELTQNVRVLYAAEAGSRAWGFESPDSDWDVRFVYVRPVEWYLSISEGRDVLDSYHSMVAGTEFDDPLLDITGWDLKKAFKMLRKSNPQLLEWLNSPIVYRDMASENLREVSNQMLRMYPLQTHYHGMAKGNFREYLQGPVVRYKKYLYVIRPLMAVTWVRMYGSAPPVSFDQLMQGVIFTYDDWQALESSIQRLLAVKRQSTEVEGAPADPVLHAWIEKQLALKGLESEERVAEYDLDSRFRDMLRQFAAETVDSL
jgi:uncharacterized protein